MSNWDVASNAWDFGTSQIKIWIDGENLKYKKSLKPENIIPRSSITGVGFKAGNLTSILTIFTSGSEINLRVPTRARSTNLAASISGFFNGDATQGNQASRKAGKSSTLRNASIVGACVFILLIMIGMSGSGNSKKKTLTKEEIKSEVSEYLNRIQLAEQPSIDATAKFLKVSEDRYAGYDAAKAAIAKAEYVQETIEI